MGSTNALVAVDGSGVSPVLLNEVLHQCDARIDAVRPGPQALQQHALSCIHADDSGSLSHELHLHSTKYATCLQHISAELLTILEHAAPSCPAMQLAWRGFKSQLLRLLQLAFHAGQVYGYKVSPTSQYKPVSGLQ